MSWDELPNLASERLGAVALWASDDFFAPKENLLRDTPAEWREHEYTDRGKWMDGWETRRRRDAGTHDWCVIKLGARGIVKGVDVETTYFTGNYPESCAIDAGDGAVWTEILPRTPLSGGSHNLFAIAGAAPATHVRLRIFPDGGVARLRAYGSVVADWDELRRRGDIDLAAAAYGAFVVSCSDMFFGSRNNLIMPGDATHMGDGWETKRRRGPGHDWSIVRLAAPGTIHRVEVDTRHFKGNAPGACDLEALRHAADDRLDGAAWEVLLPRVPLSPDAVHLFEREVRPIAGVTHVRFNIYPDGGVGRLRLFGTPQ